MCLPLPALQGLVCKSGPTHPSPRVQRKRVAPGGCGGLAGRTTRRRPPAHRGCCARQQAPLPVARRQLRVSAGRGWQPNWLRQVGAWLISAPGGWPCWVRGRAARPVRLFARAQASALVEGADGWGHQWAAKLAAPPPCCLWLPGANGGATSWPTPFAGSLSRRELCAQTAGGRPLVGRRHWGGAAGRPPDETGRARGRRD